MHEVSPHNEKVRFVDRQYLNGNASGSRQSAERRSRPFEVCAPELQARMKEANDVTCVWIMPRDVRTFVTVAVQAGEGKILKNRLASVLPCDDVVDVEGQGIRMGRKAAILATVSGPLPDCPVNLRVQA